MSLTPQPSVCSGAVTTCFYDLFKYVAAGIRTPNLPLAGPGERSNPLRHTNNTEPCPSPRKRNNVYGRPSHTDDHCTTIVDLQTHKTLQRDPQCTWLAAHTFPAKTPGQHHLVGWYMYKETSRTGNYVDWTAHPAPF